MVRWATESSVPPACAISARRFSNANCAWRSRVSGRSHMDLFQQLANTTVSLTLVHYVAARTSIQFSDDVASEQEAQGGDGIGHVTLRALGCRAGCNLGVGKVFLIE